MPVIISPTQAETLVNDYQQQNDSTNGSPLLTPDNKFLNGFFIDRESLEVILQQQEVAGVSIYLAKDPNFLNSPANHYTIVYFGAEPNPAGIPPYKRTGDIYCAPPPCPPVCARII
jgi:hypothetical protein